MTHDFQSDLDAVETIAAVPTILTVVSHVTGMRFSAVARVTDDRWVCLAANDQVGLGLAPGGELKLETTLCHEVRQAREAIVIDHVAEDEAYCQHHTPSMYGFQSYISMPIFLADGSFFGTLCALDPEPAKVRDQNVIGMFRLFADLIGIHLDTARRLVTAETGLLDAKAAAELREQFMAVLGHDLRNPLAAMLAGTRMLRKENLSEKGKITVEMMDRSGGRMAALIEDVIDLARSRLGGGMHMEPTSAPLTPILQQIVDEMRTSHPERKIEAEFNLTRPTFADPNRIARMLSNLLGNALKYSSEDAPVTVRAHTYGSLTLAVTNKGPAIPPATMERLFVPFARGIDSTDQQGLGLGLFIVSRIAAAHGGTINVMSTDQETTFTFAMPLPPEPRAMPGFSQLARPSGTA